MTVKEIAQWLNGEIIGDCGNAVEILQVDKIEEAKSGSITFLANPKYQKYLATTQATAVLISKKTEIEKSENKISPIFIKVEDPYVAFLHVLKRLTPTTDPFTEGIHPSAVISQSAKLENNISIGAYTVIGDNVTISQNTKIASGVVIGKNVQIGSDCMIFSNTVIYHNCKVGNRVTLHAGCVIGADGFGFAPKKDGTYEKIPQLGIVVIEDDVEIGANTTIDRATLGETQIKSGVKIDNLVQVAHNVIIGENTVIAAQTGISGSTKIGKNCMLGGQVGIAGHIEIADRTIIMAQSGIPNNITEPGQAFFGYPAYEARKAQRAHIALRMLPDTIREVTSLKNKLAELENKLANR